jgi:hypothetical protein
MAAMSVVRLPRRMSTEQGSGRKATRAVNPDTQPSLFDKVIRSPASRRAS